jgi:hypothetical protein
LEDGVIESLPVLHEAEVTRLDRQTLEGLHNLTRVGLGDHAQGDFAAIAQPDAARATT